MAVLFGSHPRDLGPKGTGMSCVSGTKPSSLISVKQAAERFGVSVDSVREQISQGKLPAYRIGRLIKLDPDDVEDFIKPVSIQNDSLASDASGTTPNYGALDSYVKRIIADAPLLSDEQRTRLAELLRPVRVTVTGVARNAEPTQQVSA